MLYRLFFWWRTTPTDPSDPIARGYKLFFRKVRNLLLIVFALVLFIVLFGVPSIQGDYRYQQGVNGIPTANQKLDADYWNPLAGWRKVAAGELATGCPIFVFMPLRECMNLEPYKNEVTTRVFGEEFFDGP